MATVEALCRSSRHRYWNVKECRYEEEPSKTHSSLFEQAQTPQGTSMASSSVSSSAGRTNFLTRRETGSLFSHPRCGSFFSSSAILLLLFSPSSSENPEPSLLLSLSPLPPDPLPLALSVSLCLLQLLPSTQDLPEMCRFWLLGNTTVLLKLQMEA